MGTTADVRAGLVFDDPSTSCDGVLLSSGYVVLVAHVAALDTYGRRVLVGSEWLTLSDNDFQCVYFQVNNTFNPFCRASDYVSP